MLKGYFLIIVNGSAALVTEGLKLVRKIVLDTWNNDFLFDLAIQA